MATTTLSTMRQRLSEAIGDYYSLTATGGSTSTLVDAALADYTESNDGIQGWVKMTSGAASGDLRRIKGSSGYTASSTTIAPTRNFSGTVANTHTYEWHPRVSPVDKDNAILRAIEELFPYLYLPIRDETLFVDDRLANSDFETFSGGAFTSWTSVGSPTLAAETSIVIHGSQAAKVTSGGGAVGQLTQAPTININEITNKQASFKCWVYATAADVVRVRLDWDGTNFKNSAYHSGSDQWELLGATATVPSSATQVKAICEVAAGGEVGYFDRSYLDVGAIYKYTIPTTLQRGPYYVRQQDSETHPEGPYYSIGKANIPTAGRILRLEGMDLLTRPSSDTATTEVDGERVNLIVEKAKEILYRMLSGRTASPESRDQFLRDSREAGINVLQMLRQPGLSMMPMSAENSNGTWHTEEDASGRYLVFDGIR